ncbi:MAG: hypothetical protein ABI399_02980 [Bauldia sp.]
MDDAASRRPWTRAQILAGMATVATAVAIVAYFHNRFWWAPDEGAYAWVADRIAHGAVLNRDVHDPHGGYVHFLHALSFEVFGRDFLSLRYPLALFTVVQSAIVFALLRHAGIVVAAAGGLAMAGLTFVQFINPTANWYALFLTAVLVAVLAGDAGKSRGGLVGIGFLVATVFLFRQLSGVFVAIGTLSYLLLLPWPSVQLPPNRPIVACILAATAIAALAAYLATKADSAALLLYGILPLGVLVAVALQTRIPNRQAIAAVAFLMLGGIAAALPLALYHLAHGSLGGWWQDAIVSALSLTELDFFERTSYARLLILAAGGLVSASPIAIVNGLFWLLVLLAPAALGGAVLHALLKRRRTVHPLAFIALFYSLVSIHYAIPIYALFGAGLAFAGLLAIAPPRLPRAGVVGATLFVVVVGLGFQAGQPLFRGVAGTIRGDWYALDALGPPGASIRVTADDRATYGDVLAFIDRHAAPAESILGLPMTPELYFLSQRNPPVPFAIAPLALRTDNDVAEALREIESAPPAVVVFNPGDKYTTPHVRELMDRLSSSYPNCRTIGPFELHARTC